MVMHRRKRNTSTYLFSNKDLVALYVPLIIEQMLAMLVGLADSIMVSSVGEAAVSGVSLVDSCFQLIINLFAALATGGAVTVGQYLGQKNKEKAGEAATQLVWFSMILSLGVMALMYAGKGLILNHVFGQIEADVYGHADTYMMIVNASIPFLALYNAGAAIFRSIGNSNISMRVSLIMNGINVVGNAILIYVCKCGTEGVAIPTLVSRLAAAVIMIILLIPKKSAQAKQDSTRIYIKKSLHYRANWHMLKSILLVGIPNGLENSMFQLGKIIVLSLVSTFGTYAIAANAVSNAIALFQILPGMAITLAITPVISRCVGAGDYEQAKYYNKKLMLITYVSMTAMVLFIFSLLPFILNAYNLSDLTAKTTADIIHFHGIGAIFIWPVAFSLPATFRAAGDAKACMYISSISMWIFRIGFSYVLGKYMGMGVFGIWVAMVIDWVFRAMCFVIRYFKGSWKKNAIV